MSDNPLMDGVTVVDSAGKHHDYARGSRFKTDGKGDCIVSDAIGIVLARWTRGDWSRVEVTGSSIEKPLQPGDLN